MSALSRLGNEALRQQGELKAALQSGSTGIAKLKRNPLPVDDAILEANSTGQLATLRPLFDALIEANDDLWGYVLFARFGGSTKFDANTKLTIKETIELVEPFAAYAKVLEKLHRYQHIVGAAARRYGPLDKPRIFAWDGKTITVTRTTWKFLRVVWGRQEVPFEEIGEKVWSDDFTPATTIRTRADKATAELAKHGIDLQFTCDDQRVSLLGDWPK